MIMHIFSSAYLFAWEFGQTEQGLPQLESRHLIQHINNDQIIFICLMMKNLLFQVIERTVFPRDESFAEDLPLQKI